MQREVFVVSGVRTAIGDFGGSLKDVPPTELGAQVRGKHWRGRRLGVLKSGTWCSAT